MSIFKKKNKITQTEILNKYMTLLKEFADSNEMELIKLETDISYYPDTERTLEVKFKIKDKI